MAYNEDKLYTELTSTLAEKRNLSKHLIKYLTSFDKEAKRRLNIGLIIESVERLNSKDNKIRKLMVYSKPKQVAALFKPSPLTRI